jgi:hypothetical protein
LGHLAQCTMQRYFPHVCVRMHALLFNTTWKKQTALSEA